MDNLTTEQLQTALESGEVLSTGKLPDIYLENEKIVDPASDEGKKFHTYMLGIAKKLLPSEDFNANPIQFLLIDEPERDNAYVISAGKPTIIAFTKGIMNLFKSEDELAYILGHELEHYQLKKTIGNGRVTKGEEIIADLPQLQWMNDARPKPYNPRAAISVLNKLKGSEDLGYEGSDDDEEEGFVKRATATTPITAATSTSDKGASDDAEKNSQAAALGFITALSDEHASTALRTNYVANAVAAYEAYLGREFDPENLTPIPEEIKQTVGKARFVPYKEKLVRQTNFEVLDSLDKLKVIRDAIPSMQKGIRGRPEGLLEMLEETDSNPRDAQHQQVGKEIIGLLLKHPHVFGKLYSTTVINLFDQEPETPVEELKRVSDFSDELIIAKSKDSAKTTATKLKEALQNIPEEVPLNELEFHTFDLPSRRVITAPVSAKNINGTDLPWNDHIKWAQELAKEGDTTLCEMLLKIGVLDKRLLDIAPDTSLVELSKHGRNENYMHEEATKQNVEGSYASAFLRRAILTPKAGEELSELIVNFDTGKITNVRSAAPNYKHLFSPFDYAIKLLNDRSKTKQISNGGEAPTEEDHPKSDLPPIDIKSLSVHEFKDRFAEIYDRNFALLKAPAVLTDFSVPGYDAFRKKYVSWVGESPEERERQRNGMRKYRDEYLMYDREFLTYHDTYVAPFDNAAKELVAKFNELATGNDSDRQFVRSFFLGREDARDFSHIRGLPKYDNRREENQVTASLPTAQPYHAFILENPNNLFASGEKATALGEHPLYPAEGHWWQNVAGATMPADGHSLVKGLERFKEFEKGYGKHVPKELKATINNYLVGFIVGNKSGTIDLAPLFSEFPDYVAQANKASYTRYSKAKEEDVTSKVHKRLVKHITAQQNWPDDGIQLAKIYKTIEANELFPQEQWRDRFIKKMLSHISGEPDIQKRMDMWETLLLGQPIKNLELRKTAISNWTNDVITLQKAITADGLDDGSEDYVDGLKPIIKRVEAKTDTASRYEIFNTLADRVISQSALSNEFHKSIFRLTRASLENSDFATRMGEGTLAVLSYDLEARNKAIEFLTTPLSEASVAALGQYILERVNENSERGKYLRESVDGGRPKEYYDMLAKDLYENFWDAPIPARTLIIDQLLIPAKDRDYSEEQGNKWAQEAYQRAFNTVADKLMPEGMPYSKESRAFLDAYSQVIPYYHRPLLLSCMLAAGRKTEETSQELSVGQRLALLLELMGPAERKVGQAIHSHPQTPDDIRKDMARLKNMAMPPPRWEICRRFEEVVPEELRQDIKKIGPLAGSASYFMTVKVEKKNGERTVVAIQDRNAESRAERGFRLLGAFVGKLKENESLNANISDTLTDMVNQAYGMIHIETDSRVGAVQAEKAAQLYNGLVIECDGQKFQLETAPWLSYGVDRGEQENRTDRKEFRELVEMKGVHFNHLPEKSDKQFNYKKAVAKAHVTAEFIHILSGEPFDHDRHQGNSLIDTQTNKIGLFDHGAFHAEVIKKDRTIAMPKEFDSALQQGGTITITSPSKAEKKMLGKIIAKALDTLQRGGKVTEISDLFHQEIYDIKAATGQTPDYLVRAQRALLALNDFIGVDNAEAKRRAYITGDDFKDILMAVYKSGKIDKDILAELPFFTRTKLAAASMAYTPSVSIAFEPCAIPSIPKRYDYVERLRQEATTQTDKAVETNMVSENPKSFARADLKKEIAGKLIPKTFDDIVAREDRPLA